jgi:hypothetical protein
MKAIPLLLCVAAISGCATPEQIAARRAYEAQQQEQAVAAYTEGLARQCEGIGYTRNTDPWRQCIIQIHGQNRNTLNQAILMQQLQQQQRPAYQPPAYRPPVQTNCSRDFLGNVHCTSY